LADEAPTGQEAVRSCRNHLLRRLSPAEFRALEPDLQPVRLVPGDGFEKPDAPIERICFPESGIISVVAVGKLDHRIEAGLVGYEGMTGSAVVLGDDRSPHDTFVQVEGRGHAIGADRLRAAMDAHPGMRRLMMLYVQAFAVQTAHTALANGRAKIDERLARWLAMAHDRYEQRELSLTHELLSLMLGVRRAGVTDAIHRLEGQGVLRARRGTILIRNRARLEEIASVSYGVPEATYRRLLGDPNADRPLRPAAAAAG
jgi:CRP-like cAMP-binding protein